MDKGQTLQRRLLRLQRMSVLIGELTDLMVEECQEDSDAYESLVDLSISIAIESEMIKSGDH